jgi:hypothetical protein
LINLSFYSTPSISLATFVHILLFPYYQLDKSYAIQIGNVTTTFKLEDLDKITFWEYLQKENICGKFDVVITEPVKTSSKVRSKSTNSNYWQKSDSTDDSMIELIFANGDSFKLHEYHVQISKMLKFEIPSNSKQLRKICQVFKKYFKEKVEDLGELQMKIFSLKKEKCCIVSPLLGLI